MRDTYKSVDCAFGRRKHRSVIEALEMTERIARAFLMPQSVIKSRSMHIRKMTIADYDEAYALWRSCEGMGLNGVDDTRDGIARFLARNPDTCFVAEKRGEIIGAILGSYDGRRGYIYHTAVKKEARGEGVGTRLVNAVVGALKEMDASKISLVVLQGNDGGNAFWERLGFTLRRDLLHRNKALK